MSNAEQTIGVAIINYNYGAYLDQTIRSVIQQESPFDEILVIDDGSTDDSVAIVRGFGDRVKLVEKENGGQISACIAALNECRSDYILFLDADDLALPPLVRTLRPHLATSPVKVQFQLAAIDATGRPTGSVFPTFPKRYSNLAMTRDVSALGMYVSPPTSGNVYRRQALLDLDWSVLDERDSVDGPIMFVLPFVGPVVSVNQPLGQYRVHGANISQWYSPTPELLEHEMTWFYDRWEQGRALLGWDRLPFAGEPSYVVERQLMITALSGRAYTGHLAWSLVRGLRSGHQGFARTWALVAWASLLVIPSRTLRRRLVMARRSHAERGPAMRAAIRLVRLVR